MHVKPALHVEVYLRPNCPYSRRIVQLLHDKGVEEFRAVDVSQDPALHDEMERRSGCDQAPQVFIGGRHVGGCQDLTALDDSGELDVLLYVGKPGDLVTGA
jgi:glutaredoxin 3